MKTVGALAVLLFLAGCASSINVKENPFEKTKDLQLSLKHNVTEGEGVNMESIYITQLKDGARVNTSVKFFFRVGATSAGVPKIFANYKDVGLDASAYILVDDNSYKLDVENAHKDTVYVRRGNYGGTYNELYGTLSLNSKIAESIVKAKKIMYKFGIGGNPLVMTVDESQIEKLSELFSMK